MIIPIVEITLKDGTLFKECAIYKEDNGKYEVIQNEKEVKEQFQVMPWGNNFRTVNFQTKMMNGHINVLNVESYKIIENREMESTK